MTSFDIYYNIDILRQENQTSSQGVILVKI